MNFAYGTTRWVILVGGYAIKIARFRPCRCFAQLLRHSSNGVVGVKLHQFDPNPVRAILKYVFAGVLANRTEYRMGRNDSNGLLAPTVCTFFWIVNVQPRGEPARECDVMRHPLWQAIHDQSCYGDAVHTRQFCVFANGIKLVDYGRSDLQALLAQAP